MSVRPLLRSSWRPLQVFSRSLSRLHNIPPPFPVIPTCPAPTCSCAPTPTMPEGLPIDGSKPLNGTMAAYAEQVLICTGKPDWASRIEEEDNGDNLASDLKELLGRKGTYSDPFHNVSINNSSFPASISTRSEIQSTSAYLLPSFKYVPFLPRVSFDSVQALVKGYILPTKLNPAHDALSPIHKDRLLRSTEYQSLLYGVQDVNDILVLICGHGGRDARCGIYGPLLEEEFERALPENGVEVLQGPVAIEKTAALSIEGASVKGLMARIGLISHIGGHKFAGNTIIYIPPSAKVSDGSIHPLAGCGIWYGRVEPQHVEGIVNQTILQGKVIADLFRGGIKQGGEILRL